MSFKYNERDILEKIKRQNPAIENYELNVIRMYETKRYNKTIYIYMRG